MLVPEFWAEGRAHKPREGRNGRQVTVRRWGWSDDSQEAAQQHADQRAQDALGRVLAGDGRVKRREPKVPYNGAEGVPIREEIVARHGDTIITRNSYGALCLNTPNVLFADVDFLTPPHEDGCLGCPGRGDWVLRWRWVAPNLGSHGFAFAYGSSRAPWDSRRNDCRRGRGVHVARPCGEGVHLDTRW